MVVNKIKINTRSLTGDTIIINIPISESFSPIDQSDIVERKFVETNVRASINPIIDYDRVRHIPYDNTHQLNSVTYKLSLIPGDTYGDIGFTNDDLKYRRNNLKESFIRLSFYDTDKPTTATKLFEMTIHPNFVNATPDTLFVDEHLEFKLSDPIRVPSGFAESYYLYYGKEPIDVYMRAEFNNAKTGISHKLMTSSTPISTANELITNLYTKYSLNRQDNTYVYIIDQNYSDNIYYTTDNVRIELFETELV